jgi:outer membrane protein OmpA-like peptidoglycan-associated protein
MNANARKVHRTWVVCGVACAVVAALPCVAGGKSRAAPAEENIGFFSGLALGAVAGGPLGAIAGGVTGALLGEHYHKQKVTNHELAADLAGSTAERATLARSVLELDGAARDLTFNIGFRTGDAHLTAQDIDQLTTLGKLAGGMPGVKIRVSGHADPRGSEDYNRALSQERAESVAAVLQNTGVATDRIVVEALGASGATDTGNLDDYAFERRVSVRLVGDTSVAAVAGGAPVTVASAP